MSGRLEYLLDTNILSEVRRKRPDERVISFLSAIDSSALFISVLTVGELRKGVAAKKQTDPESARRLDAWLDGLEYSFAERILGVDLAVAKLWGEWSAQRTRPVIDTLLAATAAAHDLTLVTRDIRDVRDLRVKLLDPWRK